MGKLTDLGILSNTRMTIAFWINVANPNSNWRNIFRIGNGESDYDRIPSLFIYPSNWIGTQTEVVLHYRQGTISNWNDGLLPGGGGTYDYDPNVRFPIAKDTHITFTTSGKTMKYFVNGVLKHTRTLDITTRFVNNNSNTHLTMNFYNNSENIKLKNFQIFNRALSDSEVMDVYNQVVCDY